MILPDYDYYKLINGNKYIKKTSVKEVGYKGIAGEWGGGDR